MPTADQHITVCCPHCGKRYHLPPASRGKSAKCGCGHRFLVEPTSNHSDVTPSSPAQCDPADVAAAPSCVYHPAEPATEVCLKCNSPICRRCGAKTKSGKFICRTCVENHAASAKPSLPKPAARSPDPELEIIAEIVQLEAVTPEAVSTGAQPSDDFFSQQLNIAAPQDAFQSLGNFAPLVPAASQFGMGSPYSVGASNAYASAGSCAQHPHSPVVAKCMICNKPVCGTCRFLFPSNLSCCPECAANTDYPIAPHRKIMIHASLGCAIFATLVIALLCSGLLSFLGEGLFGEAVIEALIVLPLCLGIGLGFGSWNKQEGNPAMLWVGGIWNSLGLVAWLGLMALSTFSNLAGG